MNDHPEREMLLAYAEKAGDIDRDTIARHVAVCAACQAIVEEFEDLLRQLADTEVLAYIDALALDRAELRHEIVRDLQNAKAESDTADAVITNLHTQPTEAWGAYFDLHPEYRTSGMVRRLLSEVTVELNREPGVALELIGIAERLAAGLPEVESRAVLGDVWKQRANALRHLGLYTESLAAADTAETFYASLVTGTFDVAQAQYTRAGTLFKMTRYADARAALQPALATLRSFGDSLPLVRAIMLEASIRIEEGDVVGAQTQWSAVLPLLARLGDQVEQARVFANLAQCNLRLGFPDEAIDAAASAVQRYRDLGMDAESIRSEWTIGLAHLARGESDAGLAVLHTAAAGFETRGMTADSGFVKLDICEELLNRGDWNEAEITARALVPLFRTAGVTLASVRALDDLRRSVENRVATAEVVRYVRAYLMADDPAQPFHSPNGH